MPALLLPVIYLAFMSFGLPDSALGAAWPSMYAELGAGVSWVGLVSGIVAAGTILSSLMSARVVERFGTGVVVCVSVGLTAVGLLGFSATTAFWQLCLWAVPYGLGAGAVDAALNSYVAVHYAPRHMSWLHCMWGVGTSAGPIIISVGLGRGSWAAGFGAIGLIQVAITVVLLLSQPLWRRADAAAGGAGASGAVAGGVAASGAAAEGDRAAAEGDHTAADGDRAAAGGAAAGGDRAAAGADANGGRAAAGRDRVAAGVVAAAAAGSKADASSIAGTDVTAGASSGIGVDVAAGASSGIGVDAATGVEASGPASPAPRALRRRELVRIPGVMEVLVCFFCYMGLETTCGAWAASYCTLVRGISAAQAAAWASLFYVGITAGRLVSGFLTLRFSDAQLIRLGQGVIACGIALVLAPVPDGWCAAGLVVIGLGCAPIYPSIIHATPARFGAANALSLTGLQMACAYGGTLLMSPLFGIVAEAVSPALYPVYLAALLVLMVAMAERCNAKVAAWA